MKKLVWAFLVCGILSRAVVASNSTDDLATKNDDKATRAADIANHGAGNHPEDSNHPEDRNHPEDKSVRVIKDTKRCGARKGDLLRIEFAVADGTDVKAEIKGPGKIRAKRTQHEVDSQNLPVQHFEIEIETKGKGLITVVITKKHPASTRPEKSEYKIDIK